LGAKLAGAKLSRARLTGARLTGAKLDGADLSGADLSGAGLSGADLSGADLSGADLTKARLFRADLAGARLAGARLAGARLIGIDLSGGDLSEADFEEEPQRKVLTGGYSLGASEPHKALRPDVSLLRLEQWEFMPRLPLNNRLIQVLKRLARRFTPRPRWLIQRSLRAVDPVDCTVFAPPSITRGAWLIVQVFAHRPDQTEEARSLAQELDEEARRRGFKSLEMKIERGTRLNVHLHLPGIESDPPIQDIIWQGQPTYVAFIAWIPDDTSIGIVVGGVTISRDGIPLGRITFKIKILGEQESQPTRQPLLPTGESARRYRKAFISYASKDRPEVLKRVQMLRLARIRYFQDVLKLEPGDRWERKLYRHIDKSDLFLLFWSTKAKESEWVLKEVRYAIKRKGGDESAPPEMIPVIIEGPPVPEPPEELAHLHFNDYLIYFMKPRLSERAEEARP
jgi:hypothetical protein